MKLREKLFPSGGKIIHKFPAINASLRCELFLHNRLLDTKWQEYLSTFKQKVVLPYLELTRNLRVNKRHQPAAILKRSDWDRLGTGTTWSLAPRGHRGWRKTKWRRFQMIKWQIHYWIYHYVVDKGIVPTKPTKFHHCQTAAIQWQQCGWSQPDS